MNNAEAVNIGITMAHSVINFLNGNRTAPVKKASDSETGDSSFIFYEEETLIGPRLPMINRQWMAPPAGCKGVRLAVMTMITILNHNKRMPYEIIDDRDYCIVVYKQALRGKTPKYLCVRMPAYPILWEPKIEINLQMIDICGWVNGALKTDISKLKEPPSSNYVRVGVGTGDIWLYDTFDLESGLEFNSEAMELLGSYLEDFTQLSQCVFTVETKEELGIGRIRIKRDVQDDGFDSVSIVYRTKSIL